MANLSSSFFCCFFLMFLGGVTAAEQAQTYNLDSVSCGVSLAPTISLTFSFSPALPSKIFGSLQWTNGTEYRRLHPAEIAAGSLSATLKAKLPARSFFSHEYKVVLSDHATSAVLATWSPVVCPTPAPTPAPTQAPTPGPTPLPPNTLGATVQSLTCKVHLAPSLILTLAFPSPVPHAVTGSLVLPNGEVKPLTPEIPAGATTATLRTRVKSKAAFRRTYQVRLTDKETNVDSTVTSITCPKDEESHPSGSPPPHPGPSSHPSGSPPPHPGPSSHPSGSPPPKPTGKDKNDD